MYQKYKWNTIRSSSSASAIGILMRLPLLISPLYILYYIIINATTPKPDYVGNGVMIAVHVINIMYAVSLMRYAESLIERNDYSSEYQKAPDKIRDKILGEIADVLAAINISQEKIVIWIGGQPTVNASVNQSENRCHIFISLGFLKYFNEHRLEAKSILVHELGHIFHKDSGTWNLCMAWWYRYYGMIIYFDIILSFVYFYWVLTQLAALEIDGKIAYLAAIGVPVSRIIWCWIMTYFISQRRRQCEFMADAFASITCGKSISDAIEQLNSKSYASKTFHPSVKERQKAIEQFNKKDDTPYYFSFNIIFISAVYALYLFVPVACSMPLQIYIKEQSNPEMILRRGADPDFIFGMHLISISVIYFIYFFISFILIGLCRMMVSPSYSDDAALQAFSKVDLLKSRKLSAERSIGDGEIVDSPLNIQSQ